MQFESSFSKSFTFKWNRGIETGYGNKRAGGFFDCFCFFMGDVATGLCADGNGIVINVTNNGFVSAS